MPKMNRMWAMPNTETFSIQPIADLLIRVLRGCSVIVDPFARNSEFAHYRNDLDLTTKAEYHMDAKDFCRRLIQEGVQADAVLFDPPYSPRQISEAYKSVGKAVSMEGTQNARLYREVRDGLDMLLSSGGIAISCGWNSVGFGKERGYEIEEILLVSHGGAHNDTIIVVERKIQRRLDADGSA